MRQQQNFLFNIEEEADVASIHYIKATNDLSMNDDDNFIHIYYAPFLSSENHEDIYLRSYYDSAKRIFCQNKNIIWIIIKQIK